jgi:hypothetical protein
VAVRGDEYDCGCVHASITPPMMSNAVPMENGSGAISARNSAP